MLSKVREAIAKYNMLDTTECVTVALSGGADSVALLYALKLLGYNVRALHVNHQLRGEESDRDEAFVREICEKESIPLEVHRADVSGEAKKRSMGLEECGREIRYELLGASAEKHGGKIATAHTLSDSAETVLLNMARGCALAGLTGIPPVRGNIIRPLILATRADIENFCEGNSIPYVTDSSNLTDDYSRNRVRHITVPSLKTVNPSFEKAVGRMTELVSEDEDLINSIVKSAIEDCRTENGYDLIKLRKLHRAVRSRILTEEYGNITQISCPYVHVQRMEALIERGQGREELPGGIYAAVRKGIFCLERKTENAEDFSFEITVPCEMMINGRKVILEKLGRNTYEELKKNNSYLFKNAFDCDIISSNLVIRNRRAGDRLRQAGRGITKELRRLMNEKGIPPEKRGEIPVIADAQGVVWAHGFGVDERCAVNEKTKDIVVIEVEN